MKAHAQIPMLTLFECKCCESHLFLMVVWKQTIGGLEPAIQVPFKDNLCPVCDTVIDLVVINFTVPVKTQGRIIQ